MPVGESDIVFFQSAENPSIGGAITVTPVPQSIDQFFNNVDFDEAEVGSTHYRCFYVKNESEDSTLFAAGLYVSVRTPSPSTSCELALGSSGKNGVEQILADQTVPPTGVTFSPTADDDMILFGDLEPGDWYPVWIKRIVLPDAVGTAADYVVLTVAGDNGE